jgi:hypothetical protein
MRASGPPGRNLRIAEFMRTVAFVLTARGFHLGGPLAGHDKKGAEKPLRQCAVANRDN